NVGMPNVLWNLQGEREMERNVIKQETNDDGDKEWVHTRTSFDAQGFSDIETKTLDDYRGSDVNKVKFIHTEDRQSAEFDAQAGDLANFLGWMAEPNQLFRKKLGIWVMFFLALFLGVAWRLNAVYWKDVK